MKIPYVILGALALGLVAPTSALAAGDPLLGVWNVDLAKTTPADPSVKSATFTFAAKDKGYSYTMTMLPTSGAPQSVAVDLVPDGKPRAGMGGMTTCSRANAQTLQCTTKAQGHDTGKQTFVLAPDGKTLTITSVTRTVHVAAHSEMKVDEHNGSVTAGPAKSSQTVTVGPEETSVMVLHRS